MNELRALACLVKHKAHAVQWVDNGWQSMSRCIWCKGTPKEFEELSSYPFMNVDAQKDDVVVFYRLRRKPRNGQRFVLEVKTHAYLKRFGLTWLQVRDAK